MNRPESVKESSGIDKKDRQFYASLYSLRRRGSPQRCCISIMLTSICGSSIAVQVVVSIQSSTVVTTHHGALPSHNYKFVRAKLRHDKGSSEPRSVVTSVNHGRNLEAMCLDLPHSG